MQHVSGSVDYVTLSLSSTDGTSGDGFWSKKLASNLSTNDYWEPITIHEVFGAYGSRVPVTAAKSFTGNSGSGCGGQELAASILGLRNGVIPFTLNCDNPEFDLNIVRDEPLATDNKVVMNVNVTRMGQASVAIVQVA